MMLNIPGRIDSVTGMLSVLHLLRNQNWSWAGLPGHKSVKSDGTIPLNLLRNRYSLRQRKVRLRVARQYFGDRRLGR
jgi:hypothetical protein